MRRLAWLPLAVSLLACWEEQPLAPRSNVRAPHPSLSLSGASTANATVTWLGGFEEEPVTARAISASGMIVGETMRGLTAGLIFRPPPVRAYEREQRHEFGDVIVERAVSIVGINASGLFTGAFLSGTFVSNMGFGSFLPHVPNGWGVEWTSDISDAGDVVGASRMANNYNEWHATLWRSTGSGYQPVDLGLVNGRNTDATGIAPGLSGTNTLIVGNVGAAGATSTQAFMWQNGVFTLLPLLPGSTGYATTALDVADDGTAVGLDDGHAVVWEGGAAIDLHPLCDVLRPGFEGPSEAHAIAFTSSVPRRTLIVGQCILIPAVWYDDGSGGYTAELLPMLIGDNNGMAFDVNASGQIVGYTRPGPGPATHAVLWQFTPPPLPGAQDSTPPVITPSVTGTLGNNGWHMSNVTVSWSVTDNESALSTQTGCGQTTISADTPGQTLTCSATSAGGTASQSVTIKRDATAPTLGPTVSPNPVLLSGTATAAPNAGDNLSGVGTASCDAVDTGTVGSNQSVACRATDNAGNSANARASYAVREPTTPEERADALAEQVRDLVELGILDAAQASGLIDKLNEILAKVQAGKVRVACNQLRSFINQVQGFIKSGKLTSVQGQPLIDAAEGIRTDLGC